MNTVQEKTTNPVSTNEHLASVVKRLGNPVSTILLHLQCSIFSIPNIDGVIGYQQVGNCAVVIGDPICLPQDIPELTQAFHTHCQQSNLKIVYLLASDAFAHWAIDNVCQTLIQVGEELIIDPTNFKKKQKLRWKINQSSHQGVIVKEYTQFDPLLEIQMKTTIEAWLKAKQGPQIHLGRIDFVFNSADKRIFYALLQDKIVGLLILTQIDLFQGWVVNSFLANSDAPVGTTENLFSFAFDTLAEENCHFLCLGVVSGTKLGKIVGLNVFTKFFAHLIFRIARLIFNLDARRTYLIKYRPYLWPMYFLFSEKLTISELMAIKHVLNIKL